MAGKNRRRPRYPWAPFADAFLFTLDCQEVVGRRLMRIAKGDRLAVREAQRMVSEKIAAAASANLALAGAWMLGPEIAAERALAAYSKAVRANRRRLRGRAKP
jgi:hypothetical protein